MTERLILRDIEAGDVAAVHEFASLDRVCRYVTWGPNTLEDTTAFAASVSQEARDPRRTSYTLAMVRRADDHVIGSCGLTVDSAEHRRGSLGFTVHPDHWGNGYATEAGRALIELGRNELGLERIEATCRPANIGSARALARAGMTWEGLLRSHVVIRGERQDSLLFAVVSGD